MHLYFPLCFKAIDEESENSESENDEEEEDEYKPDEDDSPKKRPARQQERRQPMRKGTSESPVSSCMHWYEMIICRAIAYHCHLDV